MTEEAATSAAAFKLLKCLAVKGAGGCQSGCLSWEGTQHTREPGRRKERNNWVATKEWRLPKEAFKASCTILATELLSISRKIGLHPMRGCADSAPKTRRRMVSCVGTAHTEAMVRAARGGAHAAVRGNDNERRGADTRSWIGCNASHRWPVGFSARSGARGLLQPRGAVAQDRGRSEGIPRVRDGDLRSHVIDNDARNARRECARRNRCAGHLCW